MCAYRMVFAHVLMKEMKWSKSWLYLLIDDNCSQKHPHLIVKMQRIVELSWSWVLLGWWWSCYKLIGQCMKGFEERRELVCCWGRLREEFWRRINGMANAKCPNSKYFYFFILFMYLFSFFILLLPTLFFLLFYFFS